MAHAGLVLGCLAVVLGVNLMRNGRSAGVLRLLSIGKVAPLAFLLVLAAPALIQTSGVSPSGQNWSPAQAFVLAAYAFVGFEGALTQAGEANNPRRDLPLAVLCVFVAVVLFYAALTWGFVVVAYDPRVAAKAPLALMGERLAGPLGLALIGVGATLSILGNVFSTAMFNSRRLVALETLGTLPRWFGAIDMSNGVPRNAVLFTLGVATILALSGGFKTLALLSVASRLFVYLTSMAALPVIRRQRGLPRFVASDILVLPAVPICLALLTQTQPVAWAWIIGAIVAGFLIMAGAQRARAVLAM